MCRFALLIDIPPSFGCMEINAEFYSPVSGFFPLVFPPLNDLGHLAVWAGHPKTFSTLRTFIETEGVDRSEGTKNWRCF